MTKSPPQVHVSAQMNSNRAQIWVLIVAVAFGLVAAVGIRIAGTDISGTLIIFVLGVMAALTLAHTVHVLRK